MKTPHPPQARLRARAALALATLAALAAAPAAHAAIVSFSYTAVGVAGTASEGATVTGSFGYDTSSLDLNPEPNRGRYVQTGFISALITGGAQDGQSVKVSGLDWHVYNAAPGDVTAYDGMSIVGSPNFIGLQDISNTALDDEGLPGTLDLSRFADMRALRLVTPTGGQEAYVLTSIFQAGLPTQPVPEPGTLSLLGAGLLLALQQRRAPKLKP